MGKSGGVGEEEESIVHTTKWLCGSVMHLRAYPGAVLRLRHDTVHPHDWHDRTGLAGSQNSSHKHGFRVAAHASRSGAATRKKSSLRCD